MSCCFFPAVVTMTMTKNMMKVMKKMMIIPIMIHDHYCITIYFQYDENDENEDKQEDDFDPQRTK